MKKIAIVAALAALSASAFAQSSVTLYGRVNTSIENQKIGTGSRVTVLQNNSSRIGFKGTEDLGGGLKAAFVLESGVNSDNGQATGGTNFWNRESSVQLSGGFGTVRLGKWTPGSYFATADYVSMHNHDTGTSSDALYSGAGFTTANKVGYITPDMGGFTVQAEVHAGENIDKRAFDLAANYDAGPMHLGAGYSKQGDNKQYAGRALYEMGAFVFGGYLQREEIGASKRNIYRLSGMYAMGASEFHLNFGGTQANVTMAKATQYTLGYNYNLSKRTKVYGFYTAVDSKVNTQDFSSFAVGVRHNF